MSATIIIYMVFVLLTYIYTYTITTSDSCFLCQYNLTTYRLLFNRISGIYSQSKYREQNAFKPWLDLIAKLSRFLTKISDQTFAGEFYTNIIVTKKSKVTYPTEYLCNI